MNERKTSGAGPKARKADRDKLWAIARHELDPNTKALHGKTRSAYVKKGWLEQHVHDGLTLPDYRLTDAGRAAADIPLNGVPPLPDEGAQLSLPPAAVGGLTVVPKDGERFRLIGKARGTVVHEEIGRFHAWVGDNRVGKTTRLDVARKALGLPNVGPVDRGCTGAIQVEDPAGLVWVEGAVAGLAPAHDLLGLGPSLFRDRVSERFAVTPDAVGPLSELNAAQLKLFEAAVKAVAPDVDVACAWSDVLLRVRTHLTAETNQLKVKLKVATDQARERRADPVTSGAFGGLSTETIKARITARRWHDANAQIAADTTEWLERQAQYEAARQAPEPRESSEVECDGCGGMTTTHKRALYGTLVRLRYDRDALMTRLEQLGPKPPIEPSETVAQLEDQLGIVNQSKGAQTVTQDVSRLVGEYTTQVDDRTELLAWVTKQLDDLNATAIATLVERVNRSLPANYRAIYEKGRLSVVGADGKPHFKGSSGAERALLALALSLAWREDADGRHPPAIMPLEFETDLAPLDPETCYEFLIALRDDPRIRGLWVSTTQWMSQAILGDLGFTVQLVGQ